MHRKTLLTSALAGVAATAAVTLTVGAGTANGAGGDWQPIGKGMTGGASGISVTKADKDGDAFTALVVRDSKKAGESRLAEVAYEKGEQPRVQELTWQGEQPVDLEAIDDVPGRTGGAAEYVAVTSDGTGYHFRLAGGTAKVLGTFALPAKVKDDNYENFALAPAGDGLVAAWGNRGDDATPTTLRAASVDFAGKGARFGDVETAEVEAPYPSKNIRHASDLKITNSGDLLVSSASDPGDDGPFDSGVYAAGHLSADSGKLTLKAEKKPELLKKFEGHKIEALDCLPNTHRAVLATDDENGGGAVRTASGVCG
ncbi:hypothetical protein [Streptomyces sp. HNM0574]|uniref:hypothetical protein n=1 Tax=Streptomyces sp. HNM0574 TaxID=2714954 RepID=UPI00146A89F0|nr:hypothetical protein [Streptomyces sp. HNM0574]NLU66690.1 hypothetical protein [Streptomyces sp. HNM0574]